MEYINNRIERLTSEGYNFRFGDYISEGFNIFGKNIGGFIGYFLLYVVISVVLSFIPFLGSIGQVLMSYPLVVGFYIVANKIRNGQTTEFGDFFKGFDHFGPLAILMLIYIGLMIVALIPFFVVMGNIMMEIIPLIGSNDISDAEEFLEIIMGMNFGLVFLTLVPVIFLVTCYLWAPMFVVFYDMSPWQAMEASRKLIMKKWFIVFLFSFVVGFIGAIGVIGLFIGLLFTYPAMMCAGFAAFADVTQLGEEEETNIEDHFVEG